MTRLDRCFWQDFALRHFERSPLVMRDVAGAPLLAPSELMAALASAGEGLRRGAPSAVGLWIDGASPTPLFELVPARTDRSVAEYVSRIVDPGRELCLAQFDLVRWYPPLLPRIQAFTEHLVEAVGLAVVDVDADSFVGAYGSTPRGIHRDPASTFMFVVEGEKHITVWPDEAFPSDRYRRVGSHGKLDLVGVSPDDAPPGIDLVGRPGDVLYWPSNHWHVARSADPRAITAVVSIGLFVEGPRPSLTHEVVDAVLTDLAPTDRPALYPLLRRGTSVDLPEAEESMLQSLARLTSDGTLRTLVRAQWMLRVSAAGVTDTPAPRPGAAPPGPLVRMGHGPLLWELHDDMAIVACMGHGARFPQSREILALFETYEATAPGAVVAATSWEAQEVRDVLDWLFSVRALDRPATGRGVSPRPGPAHPYAW